MMLFWAGLRGAVGVALAAGFKGENANALRTSVLVVVVLTVILFGGTTARMLEVLGIRTGVEDDDADSDDEPLNEYDIGWGQPYKGRWKRRGPRGEEYSDLWNASSDVQLGRYTQSQGPQGPAQASTSTPAAIIGPSTPSSESSDAEEFSAFRPASAPPTGAGTFSLAGSVPVQVPTFESLDQRYLLPLFSNPVASRNFHARKAAYRRSMLNLSSTGNGERDIGDGGDEDEGTGGRGTPEPVRDLRGAGGRLSVPSTPGANSPRFGATRQLGGSSSPGLGEVSDDARRRRDSSM
ncbi:putative Na(+)/H(+) antiporter C15A10,06 [Rhizoctonia solani AG-1 IB]|nr:putative Na(+)/H(+) antiporter C15A10,06 [Rhizoctonia solani AG-1 IB]